MLIGGSHKEWPSDTHYMEVTMEEYEDWLWEQVLEEGPPQSDDLTWVKREAWKIGMLTGVQCFKESLYPVDFVNDAMVEGIKDPAMQQLGMI